MLLATRCPHCETVFRLRQDHLTLHGGLVRCGQCQQVFDAASSLVEPGPLLDAAARAADSPAAPIPSSTPSPIAHEVALPRDAPRPAGSPSAEGAAADDATGRHSPASEPPTHVAPAAPAETHDNATPAHDPAATRTAADEIETPAGIAATHDEIAAPVADAPVATAHAHDSATAKSAFDEASAPDIAATHDEIPAPVADAPVAIAHAHDSATAKSASDEAAAPDIAATHDEIPAPVADAPVATAHAHDSATARSAFDEASAPGVEAARGEIAAATDTPAAHTPDADASPETPTPHDTLAVEHTAASDVPPATQHPLAPDAAPPAEHEPTHAARPAVPPVVIPNHTFATTESTASPTHEQDFAPGAWDMWAPWLDGGIDPALQHSGANVSTTPLVPLALPDRSGPGADGASAVARFSGAPVPLVAEPAHAEPDPLPAAAGRQRSSESAPPAAGHDASPAALEPTLAAGAAAMVTPDGDRDHREPHFTSPPEVPFATAPADDAREHFAMTRETRAPQRRGGFLRVLGGFVIGLALTLALLLIVQLAWWQREKAMVYWPTSQTLFARACATLGCHVAPPRAIDGLRLDASDLRQLDGPHVLELKVPLTNHYSVALAYPAIELTLLDEANRVAVRRVLAPRDYVRPGASVDAGIPAGATQTMVVRIETGDVTASNFRVQIFYP
ncbi:DUF3426 domain-containing protein [Burkholderia sp. FERM BP-3421]|uniref:DUF3426 domain-containing protein n=1 Tax=Burkholderia sp. FERM BP-3421 TaxID=1494466 RepID=UPI003FCCC79F